MLPICSGDGGVGGAVPRAVSLIMDHRHGVPATFVCGTQKAVCLLPLICLKGRNGRGDGS